MVQAPDGSFYGTTYDGGDNDLGTVYQLTPERGADSAVLI